MNTTPPTPIPTHPQQVPQDLHMHTVFSHSDGAVVPAQTLDLIAAVRHARVIGISDHLDCLAERSVEDYMEAVRAHGFHVGMEISGGAWSDMAAEIPTEYYVYHCKDEEADYRGVERLLSTGKPLIIAHPMFMGTDLDKLPPECLIEINNRYVWRNDWRAKLAPYVGRFRFVIDSDAHQPNWLNQNVARYVARELGIQETLLFDK
jgi:histidinol phosphatase-like PHP family hydrolase